MSDTAYTAPIADNSPTTPATMLDHALQIAAEGWLVFPLLPNSKVPLPGSNGFKSATTDPAEIARMWAPDATGKPASFNIGIRPRPDQVAVDLDVKDGRDGIRNYEALGGRIEGHVIQTPSGGLHVWCTAREPLCTKAGVVGPGIDVRGVDGFCVGPGSVIDGKPYRVIMDGALQPVPAFVAAAVGTCADRDAKRQSLTITAVENDQPYNVALFEEVCRRHPRAVPGIFHDELRNLACEAVRLAISADKAIEVAEALYLPRCEGLDEDGRQDRWVGDMRQSYEWGLGQGDHGANAAGDPREVFGEVKPAADLERLFGLTDIAPPNVNEAPRYTKLRKLSVADCIKAPARQYIIKDILAAGDVVCIVGMPGAGKSTLIPLIGYLLALGLPVFGKRTRPGKVLYAPCEDVHGFNGRVHALKLRHGECEKFTVVHGVNDLLNDPVQAREFIAMVDEDKPALVVIDTLAAAWPGLKENETDSMDHVVTLARKLATPAAGPPTTAVIIIHHPVKTGGIMPRGAGNLNGALDVVLGLEKDGKTGVVAVSFGKNRNGPTDETFAFRIESQIIGQDEDGERLTAGIAVMADAAECKRAQPLTTSEAQVVEIMRDLIDKGEAGTTGGRTFTDYGVDLTGKVGVGRTELKEACEARGLSPAKTKRDRTQKFNRCMEGLTTKGVVKLLHDIVFIDKDDLE